MNVPETDLRIESLVPPMRSVDVNIALEPSLPLHTQSAVLIHTLVLWENALTVLLTFPQEPPA